MRKNIHFFKKAAEALFAVHGKIYTVVSVTNQFGVASGGSVDTALGILDAKYTMAHELRDTGEFGFLLPADQGRADMLQSQA